MFRSNKRGEEAARLAQIKQREEEELKAAIAASLQEGGHQPSPVVQRKLPPPTDPNVVSTDQEQDDIAKAIAESLKDTNAIKASLVAERREKEKSSVMSSNNSSSSQALYPTFDIMANNSNGPPASNGGETREALRVRALYDFEAAEPNELTFKAGEIIVVIDNSDANWWKGSNHRGEGLFPSNFVTTDLEAEPEPIYKGPEKKSVQFNEEVQVKLLAPEPVEINEEKIDQLLHLLHEADPTGENPDSAELLQLEEQCTQMQQLIDAKLEKVDMKHVQLNTVNQQLMDALVNYNALMSESFQHLPPTAAMGGPQPQQHMPHHPPSAVQPPHQQQQMPQ